MQFKKNNQVLYFYLSFLAVFLLCYILRVKIVLIFATPIFWTIYILFIDHLNFSLFKKSFLKSQKKELFFILISSIVMWWIFEWFNIFISNWKYYNLISPLFLLYISYFWSFATILIAILETTDFIMQMNFFKKFKSTSYRINNFIEKLKLTESQFLALLLITGLLMIFLPVISFSEKFKSLSADSQLFCWLKYILPFKARTYLAAFVWLGFIFLIDPIVYLFKGNSIYEKLKQGNYQLLLSLLFAGLICGFFWESINYFAYTKWKYFVPILGNVKIFEMPVVGYFGFPPFAVELFVMYNFVLILFNKKTYFKY